jgi:glycosyltransferase involved in cell wall biosynthesis
MTTFSEWQHSLQLAMKLLVFAQTPPPHHGQSVMIRLMLEELGRPGQGFEFHHVNLSLSRDTSDIGRFRLGKLFLLLAACFKVLCVRLKHGPMALYYVPAPAKRGALYRDWVVMALCRPFFSKLILHWHAVGLGEWLQNKATATERKISRKLLGHADLAIVLADEVASDVAPLWPKRVVVVQNTLSESGVLPPAKHRVPSERCEILFMGLCSGSKGLFDTVEALRLLHSRTPGAYRLTVAGSFDSEKTKRRFEGDVVGLHSAVRYVGFAGPELKNQLLSESDVLCFPTYYKHEGQPLTLIEALAHDLPVVTTRWRAIPGMLPRKFVWFVEPRRPDQVAEAILEARKAGEPGGVLREHYLLNFTHAQHISALKKALFSVEG